MAVRKINTEVSVGVSGEREFNDQMKAVQNNLKTLKSEMAKTVSEFADSADSTEALNEKQRILQETYDQQKMKVQALEAMIKKLEDAHEGDSAAADKYRRQLNYATVELAKTEKQLKDTTDAQRKYTSVFKRAADALGDGGKKIDELVDKIKKGAKETPVLSETLDVLSVAGKGAGKGLEIGAKGIAAAGAAAAAAVVALLKVDEETREYRENQAKLNTAFEAAGMSAGTASSAYTELYKVLGDSDTATESAQLLAQLVTNEKDVVEWSDIAAGVVGSFGDALPINSLIEASNETAKVGKVTGALADALNWVGLSEDEFNSKLAACGDETERTALITDTLTAAYGDASDAFRENNAVIIEANAVQAEMDASLAKLGGTVSNVKNKLLTEFGPELSDIIDAFVDFTNGVEGAEEALQTSIQKMVDKIAERLPDFLDFGIDLIVSIATGIIQNLPYLLTKLPDIISSIMDGFGELVPAIFELGGNLVVGLVEGIFSKDGWLRSSIRSFIDGIKNLITGKDGFDTHSPSKWSEGVFENVMDGAAIGTDKGSKSLYKAFNGVVRQIKDDMSGFDTSFDVNARFNGGASAFLTGGSTPSKIVNLNIRTTSLSPSEVDYLITRVNQELGGIV